MNKPRFISIDLSEPCKIEFCLLFLQLFLRHRIQILLRLLRWIEVKYLEVISELRNHVFTLRLWKKINVSIEHNWFFLRLLVKIMAFYFLRVWNRNFVALICDFGNSPLDIEPFNWLLIQQKAEYFFKRFLRIKSQIFISKKEGWHVWSNVWDDVRMEILNVLGHYSYMLIPLLRKVCEFFVCHSRLSHVSETKVQHGCNDIKWVAYSNKVFISPINESVWNEHWPVAFRYPYWGIHVFFSFKSVYLLVKSQVEVHFTACSDSSNFLKICSQKRLAHPWKTCVHDWVVHCLNIFNSIFVKKLAVTFKHPSMLFEQLLVMTFQNFNISFVINNFCWRTRYDSFHFIKNIPIFSKCAFKLLPKLFQIVSLFLKRITGGIIISVELVCFVDQSFVSDGYEFWFYFDYLPHDLNNVRNFIWS